MVRHISCRTCRRLGESLCGKGAKCALKRRQYPPGKHGPKRQGRPTEYGIRLREKQVVRLQYGISERQMSGYFKKALQAKGDSGFKLLELLERRLDNVIYRLNLASTRAAAHQLVSHGFFQVGNRKIDISSYSVKPGDVISLNPGKTHSKVWQKPPVVTAEIPSWISWDAEARKATVISTPGQDDVPKNVNVKFIVEYYSR